LFHDFGDWPTVRTLHRRLVAELGLEIRIQDVLDFFRYRSGAQDQDAPARLTVDDIRRLPDAAADLNHVVSAVALAVKAYWQSESPEITSGLAAEAFGLSTLEVRRLYALLTSEYWLWRGSTANSDHSEWRFNIGDDIHLLRDVKTIDEFTAKKVEILGAKPIAPPSTASQAAVQHETKRDPRTVFMVRGRNDSAADALQDFLSALGLRVIAWSEAHSEATKRTGMASPYVLEIVRAGIDMAQAVVVLMTPDDEVRLMDQFVHEHDEPESSGQARPNVVLELGMAIALYPQRTLLVRMGRLRTISDIEGMFQTRLDNSPAKRQYLHDRLRDCGCDVTLQGRWKEAGDFAAALGTLRDSPTPISAQPSDSTNSLDVDDLAGFMVSSESAVAGASPAVIDDKPGFMDVLADGEGAFERVVRVIEEASEVMKESAALAVASTTEIQEVDAQNKGLRARLAVIARHAEALAPLADRFEDLSQTYLAEWRDIQSAIEYLVREMETNPEAREAAIQTNFPANLAMFAASVVEGAEKTGELAATLERNGQASKILRPATNRMATAARRIAEPAPIAADWQARLERLAI
jgi:predicted nucleotide-binding protein